MSRVASYKRLVLGQCPQATCEATERQFTFIYEVSNGKKFIACGTTAAAAWKNAALALRLINAKGERL